MKRIIGNSFVLFSFFAAQSAQAVTLEDVKNQLQSQPYMFEKPVGNDQIFAQYCVGNPNSAEIPQPNYSNELVKIAAQKLTLSKVSADQRLIEKVQEDFVSNLSYILEALQQVLDTTTDVQIKKLALTIQAEVSQPDANSVSETAKKAYNELRALLQKNIDLHLVQVAPVVNAELAGVDMDKFKSIISKMNILAKKEVTSPDAPEFIKLFNEVKILVASYAKKPFDVVSLEKAGQMVLANLPATDEEAGHITFALNSAKILLANLETLKSISISEENDAVYAISDLLYSLRELQNQGVDVKNLSAMIDLVKPAALQMSMNYFNISLTEQLGNPSELETSEELAEFAQTLEYSISDILSNDVAYFTASDKLKFNQLLQISIQFKGVSLQNQITHVVEQLALNTAQGDANAVNSAGSLSYTIEAMENLSADIKQLSQDLMIELNKSGTQYVLDTINVAMEQLDKNKSIDEDTYSSLSSLSYSLSEVMANLSDAAKKSLESFSKTLGTYSSVSNMSYYMESTVGEAKESEHFYFYGGVRRLYQLNSNVPEVAKAAGANQQAHWFLTQLCGEFRDRATMIEAKLKWVQNMNILAIGEEKVIEPQTLATAPNVWMRINASAYYPYIYVSSEVWEARRSSQERHITIGKFTNVDNPVRGLTVCETKYVFAEYVAQDKSFDGLEVFDAGYENYKKSCPTQDLTDYYDFRGDSNFKHYSPESNGMIWQALSLTAGCNSFDKAKKGIYTDQDCKNYFERPYFYRYNSARAGFAAWLFRDEKHAPTFAKQKQMVAIYPHKEPFLAPFSFGFDENTTAGAFFDYNPKWLGVPYAWNSSDIGFNGFTGLGTDGADLELAYTLIRDAVDRHTDWYSSGYNDGNGTVRSQAYSPFVASSYVMSSSDGFTSCGTTVQCPPDGLKRWMFIFRVKAANWYTPLNIANNEPIDFDKMWFDETSFGVSGLADSEHAWDRLGTPQEDELDSILYLINVGEGGGGDYEGSHDGYDAEGIEPVPVYEDGGVG